MLPNSKLQYLSNNYQISYMWPDLRKPNIIAQYRFFQYKALKYIGYMIAYFEKKSVTSLPTLFLEKEGANG